jgi:tetratricopeptide (TPR) repeat protein
MRITNRLESARTDAAGCAVLLLLLAFLSPCGAAAPTSRESADSLRMALALDYGNPNAHLIFARELKERGQELTAFLICEHARELFGEDAFLASFDIVFRGHIPDVLFHARKQLLLAAINLSPGSVGPLKELADLYAAHGESGEAVATLKRAITIAPGERALVDSVERVLESAGQNADAEAFLDVWCRDHPNTALACERDIKDDISQNSDSADALLDKAIEKFPDDGQLRLMRAWREKDTKPDAADADFVSAARLAPRSVDAQAGAGLFFLQSRPDPVRAMQYYLAAYFLDPVFNDWENVDQRVRDAADQIAQARIAAVKSSGAPIDHLITDANPLVDAAAIDAMGRDWKSPYADELLALTSSDCPEVRAASLRCLSAHPAWSSGSKLDQMLGSPNPWERAAAVSLWASTREATAVRALTRLLGDPVIVVRYSAAMKLLGVGNAGQAIVANAMKTESSPWLRQEVARRLAQPAQ